MAHYSRAALLLSLVATVIASPVENSEGGVILAPAPYAANVYAEPTVLSPSPPDPLQKRDGAHHGGGGGGHGGGHHGGGGGGHHGGVSNSRNLFNK